MLSCDGGISCVAQEVSKPWPMSPDNVLIDTSHRPIVSWRLEHLLRYLLSPRHGARQILPGLVHPTHSPPICCCNHLGAPLSPSSPSKRFSSPPFQDRKGDPRFPAARSTSKSRAMHPEVHGEVHHMIQRTIDGGISHSTVAAGEQGLSLLTSSRHNAVPPIFLFARYSCLIGYVFLSLSACRLSHTPSTSRVTS